MNGSDLLIVTTSKWNVHPRVREVEALKFINEHKIKEYILCALEPHFHIETEIAGRHWSDKPMRLDAVFRPRNTDGWKNSNAVLGVEFKHLKADHEPCLVRGRRRGTDWTVVKS